MGEISKTPFLKLTLAFSAFLMVTPALRSSVIDGGIIDFSSLLLFLEGIVGTKKKLKKSMKCFVHLSTRDYKDSNYLQSHDVNTIASLIKGTEVEEQKKGI